MAATRAYTWGVVCPGVDDSDADGAVCSSAPVLIGEGHYRCVAVGGCAAALGTCAKEPRRVQRARKRTRRYFATERVDVLIHCAAECNAERKVVLVEEGGVDREAMCNVLGPAVLTKLWREEIAKDDKRKKKVVFVGSFTHRARLGVCTRANAKEWINRLDRCASARKEKDFETLGVRYALSKLMVTAYALGKMREEEDRDLSLIHI